MDDGYTRLVIILVVMVVALAVLALWLYDRWQASLQETRELADLYRRTCQDWAVDLGELEAVKRRRDEYRSRITRLEEDLRQARDGIVLRHSVVVGHEEFMRVATDSIGTRMLAERALRRSAEEIARTALARGTIFQVDDIESYGRRFELSVSLKDLDQSLGHDEPGGVLASWRLEDLQGRGR